MASTRYPLVCFENLISITPGRIFQRVRLLRLGLPTNLVQNMYVERANYGLAAYDVRGSFTGRMVYKLPFGRDGAFGDYPGAVRQAFEGKRLNRLRETADLTQAI